MEEGENRRIELIESLLLDDDAIGEAALYKITALQSRIAYPPNTDKNEMQKTILQALSTKHPFSPKVGSLLCEGLIQFSQSGSSLSFYLVREGAFRWDFVNPKTKRLESQNVKRADSTHKVRVNIDFGESEIIVTFFGGLESLVYKARKVVCGTIQKQINNSIETDIKFSLKDMQRVLTAFGPDVFLINIDPHDNERFRKIVERQPLGEVQPKQVVLYDVNYFRMSGIQIVKSPEVARLIREEGIRLTEIRGGLWAKPKVRVTCRVRCTGRVEFIIPSRHFGTDTQVIYETVVRLFAKLISNDAKQEKGPLEYFF